MSVLFPVVQKETKSVFYCGAHVTADQPPDLKFRSFNQLNIDDRFFHSPETAATVVSSIQALAPRDSTIYVYFTLDDRCPPSASIAGASCGLAVSLALLHFARRTSCRPKLAATGMIQAMTRDAPDIVVGAIDEPSTKLHGCFTDGIRLLFPLANLKQLQLSDNWISRAASDGKIGPQGYAVPVQFLEEAYQYSCS